ncbi:hypothetical protein CFII68_18695, partial [Pseudomonas sp. CFII68]
IAVGAKLARDGASPFNTGSPVGLASQAIGLIMPAFAYLSRL